MASPRPRPPVFARDRAVFLAETLEDVRNEFRRHPLAGVGDGDGRLVARADSLDAHFAAAGRKLHRVAREVPDDLLQAVEVGLDRFVGVIDAGGQRDSARLRGGRNGFHRRFHHLAEQYQSGIDTQLACHDAAYIGQIFDELPLRPRVAIEDFQAIAQFRILGVLVPGIIIAVRTRSEACSRMAASAALPSSTAQVRKSGSSTRQIKIPHVPHVLDDENFGTAGIRGHRGCHRQHGLAVGRCGGESPEDHVRAGPRRGMHIRAIGCQARQTHPEQSAPETLSPTNSLTIESPRPSPAFGCGKKSRVQATRGKRNLL